MNNLIIKFADDCRNFDAWTIEKLENTLSDISCLVEDVQIIKDNAHYNSALYELIKIYIYLTGNLDNEIDIGLFRDIILQNGREGFFFIKDLLYKTCRSNIAQKIERQFNDNAAIGRISDLIKGNDSTNRTLINNELDGIKSDDLYIRLLEQDLELLNQGEKKWSWFYEKHKNDNYQIQSTVSLKLVELYKIFVVES